MLILALAKAFHELAADVDVGSGSGWSAGYSEASNGPADGALADSELLRDLVERVAPPIVPPGSSYLLVIEAALSSGTAPVKVGGGGGGGAVDAVRLCQRHDALAATMSFDEFVDLGGRQQGLSRPDLTNHLTVRAGRSHLATVPDTCQGPPCHT